MSTTATKSKPTGRTGSQLERARNHKTRAYILELFTMDEGRSLVAGDLLRDLRAMHPQEFKDTDPKQIHYHRVCLQDAELLPS